jgi:hypothetical protein
MQVQDRNKIRWYTFWMPPVLGKAEQVVVGKGYTIEYSLNSYKVPFPGF